MKKLVLWWMVLSVVWGLYRLLGWPEFVSEVVLKPVIWLGFAFICFKVGVIPQSILTLLRKQYSETRPFWKVFLLPALFTIGYFFLIRFGQISFPPFSLLFLVTAISINFSTGVVEELVYRGVLYLWLLKELSEAKAFVLVQVLFLLAHVPILVISSDFGVGMFVRAFFIVLMSVVYTLVFRLTKSVYASSLVHGIWNTLIYYFLLG